MKMSDVTALARPIDPSYPTNLAIAALALIAASGGTILCLISGAALLEGTLQGFQLGFALFLTWALGRELDPDHDLSAFAGLGLILIALLSPLETPPLIPSIWLLLTLRMVNRTVGLPAKPLVVALLPLWAAMSGVGLYRLASVVLLHSR